MQAFRTAANRLSVKQAHIEVVPTATAPKLVKVNEKQTMMTEEQDHTELIALFEEYQQLLNQ